MILLCHLNHIPFSYIFFILLGTGAQKPFIDLSKETCGTDICINTGVQNYLW